MNNEPLDRETILQRREDAIRDHEDHCRRTEQSANVSIEYSNHAIKLIFLMNGGAAVAILAFIAAESPSLRNAELMSQIVSALTFFGVGVIASAASAAGSYFSQSAYTLSLRNYQLDWDHPYCRPSPASKRFEKAGMTMQIISIVVASGAILLFACGICALRAGFLNAV